MAVDFNKLTKSVTEIVDEVPKIAAYVARLAFSVALMLAAIGLLTFGRDGWLPTVKLNGEGAALAWVMLAIAFGLGARL